MRVRTRALNYWRRGGGGGGKAREGKTFRGWTRKFALFRSLIAPQRSARAALLARGAAARLDKLGQMPFSPTKKRLWWVLLILIFFSSSPHQQQQQQRNFCNGICIVKPLASVNVSCARARRADESPYPYILYNRQWTRKAPRAIFDLIQPFIISRASRCCCCRENYYITLLQF